MSAPAAYLRQLPAPLAAINLQYGLSNHRAEQVKTLETEDGRTELRAVTGPDYGRIYDHDLVAAVQRIAGNGTGDTRWKVPGVLDWSTGVYNPMVDVTQDTTTLYASDRDVFLFLVDDLNPIEAGKLPDGSPDLFFRGFYCWNSEVGAKTLGIASFYLRAVCQNRNLWGVEDFQEISIRHSKYAANRFAHEAAPALARFADSSPQPFVDGNVVKHRLKLTSVSEPLLDAFAGDEMNLDQLMAFTVNPDHTRQEQVWEAVRQSYNKQPYQIRRMLTEDAVRAADKRVQFVGIDAYVEAGGSVMRDLFESDDGGWLQDVGLVDMLVTEKLNEEAEAVRSEGWKWIEVGLDFPYGHTPFAVAAE